MVSEPQEPRWMSELGGSYQVDFSSRLRSSLGLCSPEQSRIRLHPRLRGDLSHLQAEVLCHELAHLAVFRRYGRSVRPHGPEWEALVREAGFSPRRVVLTSPEPCVPKFYEHRCPLCQSARWARKPQLRWRCAACVAQGFDGQLVITPPFLGPQGSCEEFEARH